MNAARSRIFLGILLDMSGGAPNAVKKTPLQKWFDLHEWVNWIGEWGISRGLFLSILFIGLYMTLSLEVENLPLFTLLWLAGTAPLWLPVVLFTGAWSAWARYVRSRFIAGQRDMLLEVRIPRDIFKSPRAMEMVFNNFANLTSGESNFILRAWKGSVRPPFSFELASFGGQVHMYIWCWADYRKHVETSVYSQYPEVEIVEAEDYAKKFIFDHHAQSVFVTEFALKHEDTFPMKSYIDFELDKDPKEEFKIDPIASVFEYLSSLQPYEQVWVQIILRHAGDTGGPFFMTKNDWVVRAKKAVQKIRKDASINPGKEDAPDSDEDKLGFPRPTWKETEQIRAIERHMGKHIFEVGFRGIYISTGAVSGPTINGLRLLWRPFNAPEFLNALNPSHGHNIFDWPWQDFHSVRRNHESHVNLDAYWRRSFFYPPWEQHTQVMTSESLATIYRFPSRTVAAPGLGRILATKATAPSNLPR